MSTQLKNCWCSITHLFLRYTHTRNYNTFERNNPAYLASAEITVTGPLPSGVVSQSCGTSQAKEGNRITDFAVLLDRNMAGKGPLLATSVQLY
ncbi:hypothetical protein BaRGS_00004998 [Batillaria attramentaria]|uniref:Uncharacterized protein n=1 Tax=Batillaria attramentaria TaxID=370345 RepID=A0ABD0LWI9_9CAEN